MLKKRLKEVLAALDNIQKRSAEIATEARSAEGEELEKLNKELSEAEVKRADLIREKTELEQRIADAEQMAHGGSNGNPVPTPGDHETHSNDPDRSSAEYRDAFHAYLTNSMTVEQRDALITTENGVALPEQLESQIMDLIHTDHPILNDINNVNSGIVLTIRQHKAIVKGKAKKVAEGEANDLEENTWAKITLSGNDYSKTAELSYAEAQMSQGALENYLATEIAADVGDQMAADVFAEIKSTAATTKTSTADAFGYDVLKDALGSCRGTDIKIYSSRANKFKYIEGMVDKNGQPIFRDGVVLGSEAKEDEAAGNDIYIVAPAMFTNNVIQGIMIETDRDIKKHVIDYSGYERSQGALRDVRCAVVLTISATA